MVVPSGVVIVNRRSVESAEGPAFGVDHHVVGLADGDELVDVGETAVVPLVAVVWGAFADRGGAAGDHAVPVHRP